jgi:hypothetical protein
MTILQRREFIAGLGGAAAWPLAARAQQGDRVRRIGVLIGRDEKDPVAKAYVAAFTQALADLGWTDGRNVRIDLRWAGDDINRTRALARELVGLQPDIIVSGSTPASAGRGQPRSYVPVSAYVPAFEAARRGTMAMAATSRLARRVELTKSNILACVDNFAPLPQILNADSLNQIAPIKLPCVRKAGVAHGFQNQRR